MLIDRYAMYRAAMDALYFSGAHRMARPITAGVGAILTLHHVRPARTHSFQPNKTLEIEPEFLEQVIVFLRDRKVDLVDLDEMHHRLVERDFSRPFVALTFDDGYRDNLEFAWPVLERHGVPFAVYIVSNFADGSGELWWEALERLVANESRLELEVDGKRRTIDCSDADRKYRAFGEIAGLLPGESNGIERQAVLRNLASQYDLDLHQQCRELCMSWQELTELAKNQICTIGAHTVNHVFLSNVDERLARREMGDCADAIASSLGRRPAHFAFPYGHAQAAGPREFRLARELGYKTAVTTQPNVLLPHEFDRLMALPRITLNGNFQLLRHVDVLLSGAPFALKNGMRRLRKSDRAWRESH